MKIGKLFGKILSILIAILGGLFNTFKNWLSHRKNTKNQSSNSSRGFLKGFIFGLTKIFGKLLMQIIKIFGKLFPPLVKPIWSLLKTFNKISKKLFGKVKCELDQHVADYANMEGDPQCFLSGVCLNCGEKHIKYKHEFPDLWTKEGDCIEARYCKHCQEAKQIRNTHVYTESADKECNVIGICKICGHENKMDIK